MSPRDWLYRSALYNLALWGPAPSDLKFRLPETWPGDPRQGTDLLSAPPSWTVENHRFGFLADFAALGTPEAVTAARAWAADWLGRCDRIEPVSWSPEALGERLFVWIAHWDLLSAPPAEESFRRGLLMSLARQARHLHRIVRRTPEPARLAALRGLVAALAALAEERRLASALGWLAAEARARILPDGGHLSRNPAAQLEALRHLIDARDVLMAGSIEVPKPLLDAIDRAAPMLRFFRHGDGRLALFNGADEGDFDLIELALKRSSAMGRPPAHAPQSGYERLQAGRTLVLMDCGGPPPAPFDAESHAGALAFEMSCGKERLIVNCGAFSGGGASWRMAMRASAAHSTLVAADTSSAEIGPDGHFTTRPKVQSQRNEQDGNLWVGASHDGYEREFGLRHEREIYLSADGEDVRGEDRLVGRGGRGFVIRFHLHPEVEASRTGDGNALLRLKSGAFWRLKVAGAVLNLAESVYLGHGGMQRSQQVVLDGHVGSGGVSVKWALKREAKKGEKPGD
jgi:uncharacterized heparinase superfamily protein